MYRVQQEMKLEQEKQQLALSTSASNPQTNSPRLTGCVCAEKEQQEAEAKVKEVNADTENSVEELDAENDEGCQDGEGSHEDAGSTQIWVGNYFLGLRFERQSVRNLKRLTRWC